MSKGFFVSFEGGEGSGKTTQIRLLNEYLQAKGIATLLTREPGGNNCKLSESIRAMLLNPDNKEMSYRTEFLLFLASRAQHIQEIIAPAMEQNKVVLCDRFHDSTFVYQCHVRQAIKEGDFHLMNTWAVEYKGQSYFPDLTLMLDIAVQIGHSRALERNLKSKDSSEARFDNEQIEFHTKVNEGYRQRANKYPNRIYKVDANENVENVHRQIVRAFEAKYSYLGR